VGTALEVQHVKKTGCHDWEREKFAALPFYRTPAPLGR
jgi:hypothetical protein